MIDGHFTDDELMGFIELTLDPASIPSFDAHLDSCAECLSRHDDLARNLFFLEHDFHRQNLTTLQANVLARKALAGFSLEERFQSWARTLEQTFIPAWEPVWRPMARGVEGKIVIKAKNPAASVRIPGARSSSKLEIHGERSIAGRYIMLVRILMDGNISASYAIAGPKSPHAMFDVEPGDYLVLLEPGA